MRESSWYHLLKWQMWAHTCLTTDAATITIWLLAARLDDTPGAVSWSLVLMRIRCLNPPSVVKRYSPAGFHCGLKGRRT